MDQPGGWLWLVIDVAFVAALAAAMIYGMVMWRRRSRDPNLQRQRDAATREGYKQPVKD